MKIVQVVQNRLNEVFQGKKYHIITVAICGSHAYGMNTLDSDFDIQGIFLPPEDYILGLNKIEQIVIPKTKLDKSECEGTIFSFDKWYHLALQQNPNIIELLWHEPTMYVYKDNDIWNMLYNARNELLSKKAKHSFAGYAYAQLQRLDKLNEKVNQNPKRLEEFKKYGYSTKNASHLIRLMNMCIELLTEKQINVMRPERHHLIAIRNGDFTLKEIQKLALDKENLISYAYIQSDLRDKIDLDFANNLKININKRWLNELY